MLASGIALPYYITEKLCHGLVATAMHEATAEYEFLRIITKDFVFDASRLNANLFTVLQLVRGKGLTGRGPRVTEFYCIHRHIFI